MIKYKKYKDSGIEWLGDIPEHWKVDRIKSKGSVNARVGWKALKATEYVKSGYFFLATPNIKNKDIDFKNVNYITEFRYLESPEIKLRINDILLVKDGSTLGIVNVIKHLPSEGTINSSIGLLRFKKQSSIYIFYLLNCNYIQNIINLKKEGMGVPHLFQKDINNFSLLFPPLPEQASIANYLDSKTKAIDKKINLLTQKTEKYKELRKAIINQTVTKGLDKTVKLKDSGIEWIGEIPKHWEVRRFKYFGHTVKGKSMRMEDFKFEDSLPLLSLEYLRNDNVEHPVYCYSNDKSLLSTEDDIIIVWDGAAVGEILKSKKGYISSTIAKIALDNRIYSTKYFYHLKESIDYTLKQIPTGMGIPHLNPTLFKNFKCPFPPLSEQTDIANYLDEKTGKIDAIVSNVETQIDTLKELRKTLINDVVTGKIKVV